MKEAIITDGLWRKSLSATRALGKAGYRVNVFGDSYFTTSFWSRYTSKRILCTSAKDNSAKFLEALLTFLKKGHFSGRPVLFPMEDATMECVSYSRNILDKFADFLIPSPHSLSIAQSKANTMKFAKELGISIPETFFPISPSDLSAKLKKLATNKAIGNYIVKPVSGSGSSGIVYFDKVESLDCDLHWKEYGPLILQKRINSEGQGLGVSMLFDRESRCVASFAHGRLQEYPNTGGPSTSRISIIDPTLVADSERLLKALGWCGVAMVEWKVDPIDGLPKLLEINPRFWGSLELAIRSGVNFPLLYAEVASRRDVDTLPRYFEGIICRWLFPGELLRYLTQSKDRRESLLQFFHGLPRDAEEWDRKDLRGFISSIICPLFAIFNSKYWKFLTR